MRRSSLTRRGLAAPRDAVSRPRPRALSHAFTSAFTRRALEGPLLTLVAIGGIAAARTLVPVPTPGLILLLAVALSAVLGGTTSGLVSAAITVVFIAFDASGAGPVLTYTPDQLSRLLVTTLTAPLMAIMVGATKHRLDVESAEAAAQRSEDRQRALTEVATDSIVVIDGAGLVRSANPATEAMFGYRRSDIEGRSLTRLMPARLRDQHDAALHRYVTSGRRSISWQGVELIGLHADGREFPVEVSFGEYFDGPHRRITGIIRDITHRKELENRLLQAQKMEAVGQLAGGVAHDFNNSLTVISGFATLLEADLEGTEHAESLATIRTAADQAAGLTKQLLAFSRRQDLKPVVIDVNETLARIEPILRRLIGEHIALVVRPGDIWPVSADPAQIDTVVINLAVNARDAMPRGGTLTIESGRVVLDEEYARSQVDVEAGEYVVIVVSDTGHGIDKDVVPRIFEPFFTTKGVGAGTGLGLATVHGIVKQSGGHVWVYSEVGRGTSFKVYLPRTQTADAPSPSSIKAPIAAPGTGAIVVAEDDPGVRALIATTLQQNGYSVQAFASGAEAIDAIRDHEHRIDLLITDVVMPGVNGPDLAIALEARRPGVPVLFVSGYTANALAASGFDAARLLEKPFRPQELLEAVRPLVERRPAGTPASDPGAT